MGEGFQFIDIILFALIAGFLVLRLRSVLGRRDGHEGGYSDPFRGPDGRSRPGPTPADDNVVQLPDRTRDLAQVDDLESEDDAPLSPVQIGVMQISNADPAFEPGSFLTGARTAFEMILDAFGTGDRQALKALLSKDVFEGFEASINEREAKGQSLENTLVGMKPPEIVEAYMEGSNAFVTIKFVSEQVNVTLDSEGKVVEGDPNYVTDVTDYWTFSRDTRSRNPNWLLVGTGAPEDIEA